MSSSLQSLLFTVSSPLAGEAEEEDVLAVLRHCFMFYANYHLFYAHSMMHSMI